MPKSKISLPRGTKVPNHIALLPDGDRRWARARGLPATEGHKAGYKAIKNIIEASRDLGVHTFTVWGFSTENWKRTKKERENIMNLSRRMIREFRKEATKEDVRFIHLGRKDRFPKDLIRTIKKTEEETKNNSKYLLNVALDYGGQDEILRAVRRIVKDKVPAKKINKDLFTSYLDTRDQPYPFPDLFIRTSGEQRDSGLLPWHMVYTEYYWERDHLPDFTPERLKEAILDYSRRRRRFGGSDTVEHLKFKPEVAAKLELNWWRLRNIPEGTRFRDYAVMHLKEQFGLSKTLSLEAAKYMAEALLEKREGRWEKATLSLKKFYRLIKDELKLAFEPTIVASLEVKLWKEIGSKETMEATSEGEETAKQLYAEVYRISLFQAAKLAHLRVLATVERNLAERGLGEHHWERAEDYLEKFYTALKERVA